MRMRAVARAALALAGPSSAWFALAIACDPQDIYLFDDVPTRTLVDGGTSELPSDSETSYPTMDPEDGEAAPPEQPPCASAACVACVELRSCNAAGALLFCHPGGGDGCSLWCDVDAALEQAGNCPSAEHCDRRLGLCVECVVDADCGGAVPVCDARRGRCVECVAATHCPAARPLCDESGSRCIECNSDLDCRATGEVCLPLAQRCVQCRNDGDCSGEDPRCLPGEQRCVECVLDGDCSDPTRPICSSERECEDDD